MSVWVSGLVEFQSPRGDFGFLKCIRYSVCELVLISGVSIPSRGFWFFEEYQH